MTLRVLIAILLFTPFFAMSQVSQLWALHLNNIRLLSASVDSIASLQLSKKDTGTIRFDFLNRDTSFKRSVIIMNEKRNTLLQKELKANCNNASFLIENLRVKSSLQPVTVFITDIPSNPAKAALERVAPVAICRIAWKE